MSAPGAHGDRGSASIWVLAGSILVLTLAAAVLLRTAGILARHRAETAADLAALAAAISIGHVDETCRAAATIAESNRATVVSCTSVLAADGRSGTVTVRVDVRAQLLGWGVADVTASARAGRLPSPP
jgi:secretion/DNA translocation related TadE-like protein